MGIIIIIKNNTTNRLYVIQHDPFKYGNRLVYVFDPFARCVMPTFSVTIHLAKFEVYRIVFGKLPGIAPNINNINDIRHAIELLKSNEK